MVKWVKHKGGTAKRKCTRCTSWIKHWENHTNENRGQCSVFGCTNPAREGAHVITSKTPRKTEYIVPTCGSCNPRSSTEEFRLVKGTPVAPARKCN